MAEHPSLLQSPRIWKSLVCFHKRSRLFSRLLRTRKGQSGVVFMLLFVFVMNAFLDCLLLHQHTTATEILNPSSRSPFNYSYCYCGSLAQRAREGKREGWRRIG
ncbi:hypothetical protein XENOCAPTIV_018460, partial [Xenoophorus captivus]